jgi:tRNA threonylcarbamoyladenosine biosynthesis protein TsaB
MKNGILCIETATKNCSVALFEDGHLVSCREESSTEYIHSEKLAQFIDEVLTENKITAKNLAAVAVSSGPGSYTGLRIGVSTAKGIGVGAGIPLIAIPNLVQLALAATTIDDSFELYIPMLDARRMEVFTSVFNASLDILEETYAKVIDEDSFSDLDGKKIAIFGDGAEKCLETLNWLNVELLEVQCSARNLGQITLTKLIEKKFEDLAYFEPFYLKDFIAGTPKKIFK